MEAQRHERKRERKEDNLIKPNQTHICWEYSLHSLV